MIGKPTTSKRTKRARFTFISDDIVQMKPLVVVVVVVPKWIGIEYVPIFTCRIDWIFVCRFSTCCSRIDNLFFQKFVFCFIFDLCVSVTIAPFEAASNTHSSKFQSKCMPYFRYLIIIETWLKRQIIFHSAHSRTAAAFFVMNSYWPQFTSSDFNGCFSLARNYCKTQNILVLFIRITIFLNIVWFSCVFHLDSTILSIAFAWKFTLNIDYRWEWHAICLTN